MSQQKKFDYQLFGRVLALAKPYRKIFILAGVLAVVLAPVATLRPYLIKVMVDDYICLLYTSPSPRDRTRSRMPSSA